MVLLVMLKDAPVAVNWPISLVHRVRDIDISFLESHSFGGLIGPPHVSQNPKLLAVVAHITWYV